MLTYACLGVIFFGCFHYAYLLSHAQSVAVYKTYRYLVSTEEHVQASASCAYLYGGAGYVLERGRAYAVYACYTEETQALTAQKNLREKKIETDVYCDEVKTLYLKSKTEKAQAKKIRGTIASLDGCVRFLGELASKAEKGEYTQSELKDGLFLTATLLDGLAKNNGKLFKNIANRCRSSANELRKLGADVVLCKDVRFEQIRLLDEMICFCKQFSL